MDYKNALIHCHHYWNRKKISKINLKFPMLYIIHRFEYTMIKEENTSISKKIIAQVEPLFGVSTWFITKNVMITQKRF